ncbi:MAG: monovalent cation/H(+) antiporter subunit G [Desulfurococcaceae archaeon]
MEALIYIGLIMISVGAVSDLIAAIGMNRFRNFYLRLHAATVGTIWGAFIPIVGSAILAIGYEPLGELRWFVAGSAFVTAFLILILAPAGSHALARATHRARLVKVEPCIDDQLDPNLCVKK